MSKTPRTFAEVRRKAEGAMIYEEDLAKRKGSDRKEDVKKKTIRRDFKGRSQRSPIRKEDTRRNPVREIRATNSRPTPYTRGAVPLRESQPHEYIPYELTVPLKEIVVVLKEIGDTVRFPAKLLLDVTKDMSRYCDFYQDYGHTTDQCYQLRKQVAYLLKQGRLREFITPKGRETLEQAERTHIQQNAKALPPPSVTRTINVISGGSELNGCTKSAAKRKMREVFSVHDVVARSKGEEEAITFMESEASVAEGPHHDALVVQITIANLDV